MLKRIEETYFGCSSAYEEAQIVLFGAPFDSTTSFRPGTRFASKVMRGDSFGLESYSPYQDKDLCDRLLFDAGDLELSIGNTEIALALIEGHVRTMLTDGKLPFMIGGEHLVTLGALRAAREFYPDLHILHFDAHTDLRDHYLGEKLSHASVMRRAWELFGDGHIHQFGIRSGEREEFQWAKTHTDLHPFNFEGLEEAVKAIGDAPVYFTLDLDVLDPAVLPGTGTPEAGGVSFDQLLRAILSMSQLNVVACDLMELNPAFDPSCVSTHTACKVSRVNHPGTAAADQTNPNHGPSSLCVKRGCGKSVYRIHAYASALSGRQPDEVFLRRKGISMARPCNADTHSGHFAGVGDMNPPGLRPHGKRGARQAEQAASISLVVEEIKGIKGSLPILFQRDIQEDGRLCALLVRDINRADCIGDGEIARRAKGLIIKRD